MSLKSFDKFCENIIMGKPVEQKDLFDERQNQLRSKLVSQSLYAYAIMSFVWVLLCDMDVKIFESTVYGLVVLMAASYLIFVVRGLKNGCILGVKHTIARNSALLVCVEAVVCPAIIFLNRSEKITDLKSLFVADCLTDMTALIIASVLMLTASIMIMIAAVKKDREAALSEEE